MSPRRQRRHGLRRVVLLTSGRPAFSGALQRGRTPGNTYPRPTDRFEKETPSGGVLSGHREEGHMIHCDAIARGEPDDFGWHFVPCGVTVGLHTFVDREGVTRAYCASAAHKRNVERRFGAAEACYLCGKPTDDLAVAVTLKSEGIGLMCWRCQDDLEPISHASH